MDVIRSIFSGCVFATIVAFSLGELCTPDQWEGFEASIGGYEYHKSPGIIKEHNKVSYDAINKRKASTINYVNNQYENNFKVVIRYDNGNSVGKCYIVDLKKGECTTKVLKMPFRKACIPDNAEKVHDYTLGPMKGGLHVSGYQVNKKDVSVYIAVAETETENVTIPVTESVRGHFYETSFIQNIEYANIVPVIKDQSVFDVPKECKSVNETVIPEFFKHHRYFLGI